MNETVKRWWRTRTLREQRLLLAMLSLLTIVVIWLLIVRPLGDALSLARERHGAAVQAVAEARGRADFIRQLERRTSPSLPMPLDALISGAATEAGFPVTRVERTGPNVATFASASVRPQAFFAWVGQMEARQGLVVERLSAATNTDQTLSVQITFRARSS
jgi:general secretion pathway protein M